MSKRDYFNRAEAEVKRAKQRLPDYAGDCSACRWSRSGFIGLICEHPAVVCAAFNVADAYARKRLQECDEQRDSHGVWGPIVCGPDGALFEQRPPSWWSRFFGGAAQGGGQ